MPIVFRGTRSERASPAEAERIAPARRGLSPARTSIEIGLVNNMPDQALVATERQFIELLHAAAGTATVRLHFLSLPQVRRGEAARSHMRGIYRNAGELGAHRLDALIVTGAEPAAASLDQELYWDGLARLIDWAEHNTISTIWSCLAAHAAVLHLDGVRRHALPAKRFGVYRCARIATDAMLSGIATPLRVPHSRWNELRESELASHGYQVLTRSPEAGVDMFIKRWRSLFVFFQGHPEYATDALLREYRRDVGRFLRHETDACPALPESYLDRRSEQALQAFEASSRANPRPELLARFPEGLTVRPELVRNGRASAIWLFRNWLAHIEARKA